MPFFTNRMRQASLKLKMYMGRVDIIDNNNLEKRVLYMLLTSFAIFAFFYVIILGNMVFSIIERRAFEKDAIALSNEVGDLELTYLKLSNKVDLNLAHSLGFKEIKPNFAIRQSFGLNSSSSKLSNEI